MCWFKLSLTLLCRQAIKDVLKDQITEHEIITLARYYLGDQAEDDLSCEKIQ